MQVNRAPVKAIHAFCVECVGGNPFDVKRCGGDHCLNGGCRADGVCWFHEYRLGRGRPSVRTIRKTCLWCMGESSDQVRDCVANECALHPYRLGRNPNRTGKAGPGRPFVSGSDREGARERLESIFSVLPIPKHGRTTEDGNLGRKCSVTGLH